MADAVSTTSVSNTEKYLCVSCTNLSDGTGESAVIKVDKSTFTGLNGKEPSYFVVERIEGHAYGMSVAIKCNRTSTITIAQVGGNGYFKEDFRDVGGFSTSAAGGTGDIEFTTNGHTSGDTYNIVLWLRKAD